MIEIKCNEWQKEFIKKALLRYMSCLIAPTIYCGERDCWECLDKNIKWTIRGNEDAE